MEKLLVWICDDNEDDRFFFKQAVKKLNTEIQLHALADGEELMRLLESTGTLPDIIFLDLNMPRKDGFECLSEIKRQDKYQNIPVVIFSTSNQEEAIEKTFEGNASLYIVKPSDVAQLPELIEMTIQQLRKNKLARPEKSAFVLGQ